MSPRREPWTPDTPFEERRCLRNVRAHLRSSSRVCPVCPPLWHPWSTPAGQAPRAHAQTYVRGLLSDVERKNVEAIASHLGQDRLGVQGLIGWDDWDDAPLRPTRCESSGPALGPSRWHTGVRSCGLSQVRRESVGVARQWCGRLGKVDNGPVAIYAGDVSRQGQTLVDLRLSLPKEWPQDKARLDKAGVPKAHRGYRTCTSERWRCWRPMALPCRSAGLPGTMRWGVPLGCVVDWRAWASDLLAVPSHTTIRALETPPPGTGEGRHPTRPWPSVVAWSQAWEDAARRRIDVRDGSQGSLVVEAVKRRGLQDPSAAAGARGMVDSATRP